MKILVIDDHVLIREALRGILKELKRDAFLFDASSSGQAMQIVADHPDLGLILLDLSLPDRDGFEVLAELREQYPAIPVVVLSALQDRAIVLKALYWGASGYIPKSAKREVMISALKLVVSSDVRCNTPADLVSAGSRPQGVLPCAAIRICQMTKENRLVC